MGISVDNLPGEALTDAGGVALERGKAWIDGSGLQARDVRLSNVHTGGDSGLVEVRGGARVRQRLHERTARAGFIKECGKLRVLCGGLGDKLIKEVGRIVESVILLIEPLLFGRPIRILLYLRIMPDVLGR